MEFTPLPHEQTVKILREDSSMISSIGDAPCLELGWYLFETVFSVEALGENVTRGIIIKQHHSDKSFREFVLSGKENRKWECTLTTTSMNEATCTVVCYWTRSQIGPQSITSSEDECLFNGDKHVFSWVYLTLSMVLLRKTIVLNVVLPYYQENKCKCVIVTMQIK